MLGSMMTYYRAWENRRFVRSLLREKQPEFAAALESAVQAAPGRLCHGSRCSGADELTTLAPHTPHDSRRSCRAQRPARSQPPTAALA